MQIESKEAKHKKKDCENKKKMYETDKKKNYCTKKLRNKVFNNVFKCTLKHDGK
jgi:hypothetical protein